MYVRLKKSLVVAGPAYAATELDMADPMKHLVIYETSVGIQEYARKSEILILINHGIPDPLTELIIL